MSVSAGLGFVDPGSVAAEDCRAFVVGVEGYKGMVAFNVTR